MAGMPESEYDMLICVYCDRDLPGDATWCGLCHEYKGLMTVEAWEKYTGESWFGDDEDHTEGFQMSDVEADADTLASAGWGTDEDYGFFGEDY